MEVALIMFFFVVFNILLRVINKFKMTPYIESSNFLRMTRVKLFSIYKEYLIVSKMPSNKFLAIKNC